MILNFRNIKIMSCFINNMKNINFLNNYIVKAVYRDLIQIDLLLKKQQSISVVKRGLHHLQVKKQLSPLRILMFILYLA